MDINPKPSIQKMKITSTNDGGVMLTLSAEEVGAILKASQQTQLFEEPTPVCQNIYKGLREHTVAFVNELRERYDRTWIDMKSERFQEIRYRHQISNYGQNFLIIENRGGLVSEMNGRKYARIRFLW